MKHHNISENVVKYIFSRTLKELNQLTRTQIAEVFNINLSYLSEKFKKDTKMSVFTFIEIEKMSRAKNLLALRKDLTVKEISELIGIARVNQFRQKFKKYFYITPGQYRQCLKSNKMGLFNSHIL